ncbi:hypothetical protein KQX54_000331 [Cotesia glomerata]|uniref:Uncharacterized protein n=1 Tax=Cotesia glomerata TaxID=32391 RepID=A0AAV7IEX7_COTGL|nr:hypothetical protein KQX54_000331 [Cotesia glomerata]
MRVKEAVKDAADEKMTEAEDEERGEGGKKNRFEAFTRYEMMSEGLDNTQYFDNMVRSTSEDCSEKDITVQVENIVTHSCKMQKRSSNFDHTYLIVKRGKRKCHREVWKSVGIYPIVIQIISRLSKHADSLLDNVTTNKNEGLNSIANKTLGGRRINYSQRNAFNLRVSVAVIGQMSRSWNENSSIHEFGSPIRSNEVRAKQTSSELSHLTVINVSSIQFGREFEKTALKDLAKELKMEPDEIKPCGLFIDKDIEFLDCHAR